MFVVSHFVASSSWSLFKSIFKWMFWFTSAPPSLYYPDYTGSEENIDISVLGLQSKLNLPFKHPPTHSHKSEAYARRPGYNCSDHTHVDGAYLCDGVCVCVCDIERARDIAWLSLPSIIFFGFNPSCLFRLNCFILFLNAK